MDTITEGDVKEVTGMLVMGDRLFIGSVDLLSEYTLDRAAQIYTRRTSKSFPGAESWVLRADKDSSVRMLALVTTGTGTHFYHLNVESPVASFSTEYYRIVTGTPYSCTDMVEGTTNQVFLCCERSGFYEVNTVADTVTLHTTITENCLDMAMNLAANYLYVGTATKLVTLNVGAATFSSGTSLETDYMDYFPTPDVWMSYALFQGDYAFRTVRGTSTLTGTSTKSTVASDIKTSSKTYAFNMVGDVLHAHKVDQVSGVLTEMTGSYTDMGWGKLAVLKMLLVEETAEWVIGAFDTGDSIGIYDCKVRTPAPDTPAPDTPAPDTPAPDTPAPKTPAPDTPAPDTPVPDTPAPKTPAPDTPAPKTPAPDTPAPDTPAPDTPAPDTPAPDTPAPKTPAPDTPAPDTPAPDTPAPDTPAPDTPAPDTPAPDTPAPKTPAPDTPAPKTPAPDTPAPDTPAPDTPAPDTPAPDTPAPKTPAPDTPAPDTPAPDTPAPKTPAPDTPAPDTPSPDTPAPDTPAPKTPAPDTPAPLTPAPATPAPPTPAPDTDSPSTLPPSTTAPITLAPTALPTGAPLNLTVVAPVYPEEVEEKMRRSEEVAEVAGETAVIGVLSGGAAAGPALRLVTTAGLCRIGEQSSDRTYPRVLHPTQWVLLDSQSAGMVVGNFMFVAAFWLAMVVVVKLVSCTRFGNTLDTLGLCRFPSAPLFVFQFFLQGTSLGAMVLILEAPSPEAFVLGASALLFCVAVPVVLLYRIAKDVPGKAYYTQDPAVDNRYWMCLLIGPGEWVSRSRAEHWAYRYSVVIRPFTQGWACFSVVEMSASLAIAAAAATRTTSMIGCGHKKMFIGTIFLVLLAAEMVTLPRSRVRDNYLSGCSLALQIIGMTFMASGYYNEDMGHPHFGIASTMIRAGAGMIMLRTVIDVVSEIYIFCVKRRQRLQTAAFSENEKHLKEMYGNAGPQSPYDLVETQPYLDEDSLLDATAVRSDTGHVDVTECDVDDTIDLGGSSKGLRHTPGTASLGTSAATGDLSRIRSSLLAPMTPLCAGKPGGGSISSASRVKLPLRRTTTLPVRRGGGSFVSGPEEYSDAHELAMSRLSNSDLRSPNSDLRSPSTCLVTL